MIFPDADTSSSREAYEPGGSPPRLEGLRSAIRLVLRAGVAHASANASADGLGIDSEVRSLAAGAHVLGIRAEQLLILMKETWLSLPEARALDAAAPGGPQLSRLITLVLDEFYRVRTERAD
jgi:hypothetical protein